MSKKTCLICQPCGLGDIFYMQKIAKTYYDKGYEIWWPVIHEFNFLKEYIPYINWVSWEDKDQKLTGPPFGDHIKFPYKEIYDYSQPHIFTEEFVYINGFSSVPPDELMMPYKYKKCNLEGNNWVDYFNFERNVERENELYNLIGLKGDEDYVLVNRLFQTRPHVSFYSPISNDPNYYGKAVVEWTIADGYNPFDWCKVIENASSIVTIDTSIQYLIEKLAPPKVNEYICYPRNGQSTIDQIEFLFKTPWKYQK